MRALLPLVLGAFLVPAIANAQIVNVLDAAEDRDQGVWGSLELPVEWRSGNPSLTELGVDLDLAWQQDDELVLLLISEDYGVQGGERYMAEGFEHLRYRRQVTSFLGAEAFIQHGFNEFQRLKMRTLIGAGPRFTVATWDAGEIVWGSAYMFEYEVIDEGDVDAGDKLRSSRWSNYAQIAVELAENLTFSETVFAQPVITDPEDLRLLNETALRISAGGVYMEMSLNLTYDTRVPLGVDATQTALSSALGYAF